MRVKPTGAPPLVFGNLPPVSLEFSAQRLAHNIGYLRFNVWLVPQLAKLRAALSEMRDAPGLIIDLRGNPGGVGFMANGFAGNLLARETSLGRMQLRTGYLNFPVYPQTPNYAGPLVILLDYGSASTSEIFAAALQESGRATVIGEPSAGAALPSLIEKLPNGALLQYAVADYQTPRGTLIEGHGVMPDVAATLTRDDLLKGYDAPLEAALTFLQTKKTP